MSIYQLKSRAYYIEKSFENENFRENILSSVVPRSDIFLIDEHFRPISATNKHAAYLKVNIYKINKDDYDTSMNLKYRNIYDMTITCEKFVTQNPSVINFLNSYLSSEQKSEKIKRIRDKMTFLRYSIEYK